MEGVHMGARALLEIYIIDMVWQYRWPNQVGRKRGIFLKSRKIPKKTIKPLKLYQNMDTM
jgi:hypothetical protein